MCVSYWHTYIFACHRHYSHAIKLHVSLCVLYAHAKFEKVSLLLAERYCFLILGDLDLKSFLLEVSGRLDSQWGLQLHTLAILQVPEGNTSWRIFQKMSEDQEVNIQMGVVEQC